MSPSRGDVASDGDRRRRALRVEHGTGGDVDVADDVDHGIGLYVAHTRNRDAGVVPRGDAGEVPRGEITTGAGVRRRRRTGRGSHRRPARERERSRNGKDPQNPEPHCFPHEH